MPTGQKSSFSFGTTGISLDIISIEPPQESVGDIALPHVGLDVGDYIPYEPEDLIEGGEFSLVLANDMDTSIPLRTKETCTWTKPLQSGDATAAAWSFDAYIKSSQDSEMATSERGTINVVVKVAGNVTKTPAVAS